MKYLLSKSIQIIVINIIIAVFVTMCFSNLVVAYRMASTPSDTMSDKYAAFSIGFDMDKVTAKDLHMTDLITYIASSENAFTLIKTADSRIDGLYAKNTNFSPNLISGRTISQEEFDNGGNVILISEALVKSCVTNNGITYYIFGNKYYEVIGVYTPSSNEVNKDAVAYYNLHAENIVSDTNSIVGTYYLDTGKPAGDLVAGIDNYCSVRVLQLSETNTFWDYLNMAIASQIASVIALALILVMVLLNSINVVVHWLDSRKKELAIRRMSGANHSKISFMLIRDYLFLITISYVVGLFCVYIIRNIDMQIFIGFDLSLVTLLIAYAIILMIGIVVIVIMLFIYTFSSTSKNIRG